MVDYVYCPPVSLVGGSPSPSAGGPSSGSASIVFCISAVPVASVVSVESLLLLGAVVVPVRLDASSSVAEESSATPLLGVEVVVVVAVSVVLALLLSLLLSNVDTDSSNTFSQSPVLVSPSSGLKSVIVSLPGPQSKESSPPVPLSMSSPMPP